MQSPTSEQIKQARRDAGLTQTEAAELIYKGCRAWQQYEKCDRAMDAAYWELFLIKTKQAHNAMLRSAKSAAGLYSSAWKNTRRLTQKVTSPPGVKPKRSEDL